MMPEVMMSARSTPRMILLGVGTALPDVDRDHTHMVWDGPGGPLLIDAGGSTYQRLLRAGIDPQHLRGVLLTHSHADHINGLPALLFSLSLTARRTPLVIYGLAQTLALVQAVLTAFQLEQHMISVVWKEIAAGDTLPLSDPQAGQAVSWQTWHLRTAPTRHSRACLALRFEEETSGAALAYSCDTAPCQSVADLLQGARVIIHEATTAAPSETHTTPREAGTITQAAGAERLILVHYSPRWTMPEAQALAEVHAGGFVGTAEIGREGQVVELLP